MSEFTTMTGARMTFRNFPMGLSADCAAACRRRAFASVRSALAFRAPERACSSRRYERSRRSRDDARDDPWEIGAGGDEEDGHTCRAQAAVHAVIRGCARRLTGKALPRRARSHDRNSGESDR